MPRTDGWHTFGVDWQPGRLDYYYNGVRVGRVTRDVPRTPHYLIVNLATSGEVIEETLLVDYVRVWRRRS
jgi:beta-glucanase (GH16 family)